MKRVLIKRPTRAKRTSYLLVHLKFFRADYAQRSLKFGRSRQLKPRRCRNRALVSAGGLGKVASSALARRAKWSELVIDASTDSNGVFIAFKDGEPVGFCQCNDEYAEDNKGNISILGVAQESQGLGIGEALLQTGIVYSASKGFDTLELNVDTGNESGALKLYEKVGFKPESSWIQLHRP